MNATSRERRLSLDKHRTLRLARCGQCCDELWPAVERIAIRIKVLEDICAAPESKAHSPEREALADLIVSLFWDGNRTPEELRIIIQTSGYG